MIHACIHANKKSVWVWLTGIFRENHKLPLELYRQSPCFDNRNGRYGYLDSAQWIWLFTNGILTTWATARAQRGYLHQ